MENIKKHKICQDCFYYDITENGNLELKTDEGLCNALPTQTELKFNRRTYSNIPIYTDIKYKHTVTYSSRKECIYFKKKENE